jgi:hypothetical protein
MFYSYENDSQITIIAAAVRHHPEHAKRKKARQEDQ